VGLIREIDMNSTNLIVIFKSRRIRESQDKEMNNLSFINEILKEAVNFQIRKTQVLKMTLLKTHGYACYFPPPPSK
jgi:hypothetical protein